MAEDGIQVVNYDTAAGYGSSSSRWWLDDDPANNVFSVVHAIDQYQDYQQRQALIHARLYCNMNLQNLYGIGLSHGILANGPTFGEGDGGTGHRVTYNVVKSCIDTAASKIAKNKPRVMFLTSGGDYAQQTRAKNLTKFVDGLFDATKIYAAGQRVFVDGCVFGTGIMKLFTEGEKLCAERVLPTEIFVDDAESIYGNPRSLYQRKYVYRDVLLDMFGDNKKTRMAIEAATGADPTRNLGSRSADMIPIIEAWHLRRGPDAKDGRRVIAISGTTLIDEEYKKDYFPFVKFPWSQRLVGWHGQGLAEELVGIQLEINKLLRTIQRAQHLMSVPRVFMSRGAKIVKAHINNEIGAVIETNGEPPSFLTPPAMSDEIYQHLERLFRKSYEVSGISALSASSTKPSGLTAAVALREFHEIESERFIVTGQRYEQMFVDAAEILIDMARDLYGRDVKMQVRAPGAKFIEKIDWEDVSLERDQYIMRAFPTSLLPTSPAGRFQKITELYEAGFIDRERAMSLLDFPDLESVMSLETSAINDVKRIIDNIMEHGKYESPEPYMNLELAVKMGQGAYLFGRNNSLPEKRLEMLRQFMDDAQELLLASAPPEQETGLPEASPDEMAGALPPAPSVGAQAPMTPGAQ